VDRDNIFFVAQRPKSGRGRLIFEVATSHTHTHTHTQTRPVGLLWTSDQLVAEAATYTTHNTHKRRTSMPSAGFETAVTTIKRLQTYTSDRTATGICRDNFTFTISDRRTNCKPGTLANAATDLSAEILPLMKQFAFEHVLILFHRWSAVISFKVLLNHILCTVNRNGNALHSWLVLLSFMHVGFFWIHIDSYAKISEVCKFTVAHEEQYILLWV
jgi:hypothetical protein